MIQGSRGQGWRQSRRPSPEQAGAVPVVGPAGVAHAGASRPGVTAQSLLQHVGDTLTLQVLTSVCS